MDRTHSATLNQVTVCVNAVSIFVQQTPCPQLELNCVPSPEKLILM